MEKSIEISKIMNKKEGILYKTRCYLIGGMQNECGRDWRDLIKKELSSLNIIFFDPYHKPFLTEHQEDETVRQKLDNLLKEGNLLEVHRIMKPIRADDLRATDLADFTIARIDPSKPTFGTTEELTQICRSKKPAFIIIQGGIKFTPLWLLAMFKPHCFYNSLEDVILMIKNINSGKIPIHSENWRILKDEYK